MQEKKEWLKFLKYRYINWIFSEDTKWVKDGNHNWVNKSIDDVFSGKASIPHEFIYIINKKQRINFNFSPQDNYMRS
jgi:hypothetical protein